MITIVDYGMGNLGSIVNMLKRVGAKSVVSGNPEEIEQATRIILPGVGAFDSAMRRINESGLDKVLGKKALIDKIPVLGICLGMQLLTEGSDEGELPGLGWIPARAISFKSTFQENSVRNNKLKVPHMGWNLVQSVSKNILTEGFDNEYRFYFVHSFYVKCKSEEHSLLKTHYGIDFDSGIHKENIYGAQFHPEKSHKFGMKLLSNFNSIN